MSEKAYKQSLENNTYVFMVPLTVNSSMIAQAVAEEFKVTVEDVRTSIVKGKTKKSYRKGARPVAGKRADMKKAYVTIKEGDNINIFGEMEKAEEQQEKQQAAMEKATERLDKKEAKKQNGGLRGAFNRGQRQTQNKGGDK
jgi:large subunit ribosomal protein L23